MLKQLLEIFKNRVTVGGINFLLELLVGVFTEWQRTNRAGGLDAQAFRKKQEERHEKPFKFNSNDFLDNGLN